MDSFTPQNGPFRGEHVIKEIEEEVRNLKVTRLGDEFLLVVMMGSLIEKKIKIKISEEFSQHIIFKKYFYTYFLNSNLNYPTTKEILKKKKDYPNRPDLRISRAYTFNSLNTIRKCLNAISLSNEKIKFSDSKSAKPIEHILSKRNHMVHELDGMNDPSLRNMADALRTNFDSDLDEIMTWVKESFSRRYKVIKDIENSQKSVRVKKSIDFLKEIHNEKEFYDYLYCILEYDVRNNDLEGEINIVKNNTYEKKLQKFIKELENLEE